MAFPVIVQRLAQGRDMDLKVTLFDDTAGPKPHHQIVFADHLALCCGQRAQDVQRPPVQLQRLAVALQLVSADVKPEATKAD
jgi:hypothetical protein